MYARVVSAQVKPGKFEELKRTLEESILPCAAEQPGFQGAFGLFDPSTGRGILVTLWKTGQDLVATECSGFLGAQIAKVAQMLDGPAIRESMELVVHMAPAEV